MKNKEEEKIELSAEEKKLIKERRNYNDRLMNNKKAQRLGVMSDLTYVQYQKHLVTCDELSYSVMVNKNQLDKNQEDISDGETKQRYSDGVKKTLNDLKAQNVKLNNNINIALSDLRVALATMYYQCVGIKRVDGEVFFTEKNYVSYVDKIEERLMTVRVDLYHEPK